MNTRPAVLMPALAVAFAGALWGLLWLPMRALDSPRLPGDWVTLLLFCIPALLLLPAVIWRRALPPRVFMAVLVTGLFTGAGSMLYALSLVLTTVVKALLLFYLTPVWSTVLEYVLLGTPFRRARVIALILGILGLVVILETDGTLMPSNTGDWIALLSGVAWAYGTVRLHKEQDVPVCESTFAYFVGASVVAIVIILLPMAAFAPAPEIEEVFRHLPVIIAIGLIMIACMVLVFWSTLRLSPARVGLLLMVEVVIGIVSASMLTDEPFGVRELIGSVLIVSAAVVEVMQREEADTI